MESSDSALLPIYEPQAVISSENELGVCHFVVDRFILGRSWGGVRAARDVDLDEVKVLARTMTLKSLMTGVPIGGGKVGVNIVSDFHDRQGLLELVTKTIGPYVRKGAFFPGTDIGFNEDDVNQVLTLSGIKRRHFAGALSVGDACAKGILACLNHIRRSFPDIGAETVALEGFGRLGVPTARLLSLEGFRIISISTLEGALLDAHGLDVEELASLSKLEPEKALQAYSNLHSASTLNRKEELNSAPADILIPGARALTIDRKVAERVQAKIVCPLSNSPATALGEEILARREIVSMPDFISNSGGLIASFAQQLGANREETDLLISTIVTKNLELVFRRLANGEIPKKVACDIAMERLNKLSSNERSESLRVLTYWVRTLGVKAVMKGLTRYLSLKLDT